MKYYSFKTILLVATCSLAISGCSTRLPDYLTEGPTINFGDLYLVGNFTWWDIDEKYHLTQQYDNVYATTVSLIADGQPYEFKFIDTQWSPQSNCGAEQDSNPAINLSESVDSACHANSANFKFTPERTGEFYFSIDFDSTSSPVVSVTQVQQ